MATLDRGGRASRLGVDVGYTALDSSYSGALRFDFYGQYMVGAYGIYGSYPFVQAIGGDDETISGNTQVGALYAHAWERLAVVARLGVALPTEGGGGSQWRDFYGTWPRLTDLVLAVPDAASVRLGVSPRFQYHRFFAGVDAGFDIGVGPAAYQVLRLNAGGGIAFERVAASLELVNVVPFKTPDGYESALHSLTAAVRLQKRVRPFFAIGVPIDALFGDIAIGVFFAAGAEVTP